MGAAVDYAASIDGLRDLWRERIGHPPTVPKPTSKTEALDALDLLERELDRRFPIGIEPAETKPAEGTERKGRRGGKRPLEESDPVRLQVYERIRREHRRGEEYVDAVGRLRANKDFAEQVQAAGLTLNTHLVRTALAFFDQRRRAQARNKQETGPA
jgi:hypothetical protein